MLQVADYKSLLHSNVNENRSYKIVCGSSDLLEGWSIRVNKGFIKEGFTWGFGFEGSAAGRVGRDLTSKLRITKKNN